MFTQPLENALVDAIRSHDLDTATTLIGLISKNKTASLFSIDDKGESFLHIALKQKATNIFELLYKSIKNTEKAMSLLSMPDSEGNSLFALALDLDTANQAKTLFEGLPLNTAIELFFKGNNEGNTPLHLMALKEDSELFDFILEKIKSANLPHERESKADLSSDLTTIHSAYFFSTSRFKLDKKQELADSILNKTNQHGQTPLHLAASTQSISKIIKLINAGSSPFLINGFKETALDLLERATDEDSSPILPLVFRELDPAIKQQVLVYYRNKLLLNQENNELKELYFLLAGTVSLTILCNAYLEFNKTVPIKTGLELPKLFLEEVPDNYRRKVLESEKEQGLLRDKNQFTQDMLTQLNKEELFHLLSQLEQELERLKIKSEKIDTNRMTFDRADSFPLVGLIIVNLLILAIVFLILLVIVIFPLPEVMAFLLIAGGVMAVPIGSALLTGLEYFLFLTITYAIDSISKMQSNVPTPLSMGTILTELEDLAFTSNWPDAVTSPLARLIEQVKAKETLNVDEATLLHNLTSSMIEELKTTNTNVTDSVSIHLSEPMESSAQDEYDDKEPLLAGFRFS